MEAVPQHTESVPKQIGIKRNGGPEVVPIRIINELKGKADCVYLKMVDEDNNINRILVDFRDGDKPSESDLVYQMSSTLGNETNASMATPKQSGIPSTFVRSINENRAENINTALTIARTLIHEGNSCQAMGICV